LGKELKRIPNKHGHICWGFFLSHFPISTPTSVFPFFPALMVEENVCNTLRHKTVVVLIESLDQISKAIKDG